MAEPPPDSVGLPAIDEAVGPPAPRFDLFPAIDILKGKCVRLLKGDYGASTEYGDPRDRAREIVESGVAWLHVVDLDAAKTGHPVNRDLIAGIVALARDGGTQVQVGGGVRTHDSAMQYRDLGVSRVIMGTVAYEDPSLVESIASDWEGGVCIGCDYRKEATGEARPEDPLSAMKVAGRGWLENSGWDVGKVLRRFGNVGAAAVIATDIDRDGSLEGPDAEGLANIAKASSVGLIASGGVSALSDIAALERLSKLVVPPSPGSGLIGVIVGKALLSGRFGLPEAIAVASGRAYPGANQ